MDTIARTLSRMAACSRMVEALDAADMLSIFEGSGPFTLFVPTNDACEAMTCPSFSEMLDDADLLDDIMLYHVLKGAYNAQHIASLAPAGEPVVTANTAQGETMRIRVEGGQLSANGHPITHVDIRCANGIMHLVSAVLVPPLLLPSAATEGSPHICVTHSGGTYRFSVKDGDGTILAASQGFVTKDDCLTALARLREVAPYAEAVEEQKR